jgi:hypothetical protein
MDDALDVALDAGALRRSTRVGFGYGLHLFADEGFEVSAPSFVGLCVEIEADDWQRDRLECRQVIQQLIDRFNKHR